MPYRRHDGNGFRGWVRDDFAPPPEILENPDAIGRLPGAEHLLDCSGRQIHRVPLSLAGEKASCFTYYFTNGSWPRSLRRSYALRTLRTSEGMRRSGLPTLEVLAALKRRGEILNWRGLLVAREIPGVLELPSRGAHVFQIHAPAPVSTEVAEALGSHLASFHAKGFFHGDLKTRHILVQMKPGSSRPETFHLVDLEKTVHLSHAPQLVRLVLSSRDLVQLLASLPLEATTDFRARFLDSYLKATAFSPRNKARLRRILELYGESGVFQQGNTLAQNVWRLARTRSGAAR